jgi:hypothetical protein
MRVWVMSQSGLEGTDDRELEGTDDRELGTDDRELGTDDRELGTDDRELEGTDDRELGTEEGVDDWEEGTGLLLFPVPCPLFPIVTFGYKCPIRSNARSRIQAP